MSNIQQLPTPPLQEITHRLPDLEPELRKEIQQHAHLIGVGSGKPLIGQGSGHRGAMLLLEGLLGVYREEEGREVFLYHLKPGEACAMSLVCQDISVQSQMRVSTAQPSRVLLLPYAKTEQWVRDYPSWHRYVVNTYQSRFKELLAAFDAIAFRDLDERLRIYLKRHLETAGSVMFKSHQEIATELNTSREVVSRLLKKLEQKGVLELKRGEVRLTDEAFFLRL
ncbi:MAG: Crp/Fnr family transcriptional regulator [Bacteroidota bacterium]